MDPIDLQPPTWQRFTFGIGLAGLIGLVLSAFSLAINAGGFYRSYLVAWLFWVEISLGCLLLFLLIHLVQGGWAVAVERILAAGARTLMLMAILFVPLLFGLQHLYLWAAGTEFLAERAGQSVIYLTVPFFVLRAAVSFLLWIGLALALSRWSYASDEGENETRRQWGRRLSALGIVLFVIAASLTAFDWSMSLDPLWFSSIYGWLAIARQGLVAFAFAILILWLLARQGRLSSILTQRIVDDLGNLLLASVLLWTYLHFFQYLIIWYGNLPLEVRWFVPRLNDGWGSAALLLVIFHFALPFLILVLPGPRRTLGRLALVAGMLLLFHLVEQHWLVMPALSPTPVLHWLDLALPLSMGGLWTGALLWSLHRHLLAPINHPVLQASVVHQPSTSPDPAL